MRILITTPCPLLKSRNTENPDNRVRRSETPDHRILEVRDQRAALRPLSLPPSMPSALCSLLSDVQRFRHNHFDSLALQLAHEVRVHPVVGDQHVNRIDGSDLRVCEPSCKRDVPEQRFHFDNRSAFGIYLVVADAARIGTRLQWRVNGGRHK